VPIPIPAPSGGGAVTPAPAPAQPRQHYLRERQGWAADQERFRHNGALYYIGEWIMFFLMWHELDFERGLVPRCSRCWAGAAGSKGHRVAEVYRQPIQNECPVCFGTTFEGGYRARIIRPAIVADVEETERSDKRGSVHPGNVTFETTYDFRCRPGDFAVRSDGSRWRVQGADRLQVRTGFEHPSQADTAVAYKLPAALEESTSVAYKLPPTSLADVHLALLRQVRFPADFSDVEDIRGQLIPPSILD
jgi:hypothetical protein